MSLSRWVVFKLYPSANSFSRRNVAGAVYESLPLAEGLRRLGWTAYPAFSATMAGRWCCTRSAAGWKKSGDRAACLRPGLAGSGRPRDAVRARLPDGHAAVYDFVDTYHYGVLEGTIREHGFRPKVKVNCSIAPRCRLRAQVVAGALRRTVP